MSLQNIVSVQISRLTTVPTRAGFGTGAFLSNTASFSGLTKSYASLQEVTDDATAGTDTAAAAAVYFGQQLAPTKLTVIKNISGQDQIATLTFSAELIASNSTTVTVDGVDGTPVVFATDHETTMAAIASGITSDFSGDITASYGGTGNVITLTADVADTAFTASAEVTGGASQATVAYQQTTAPGGLTGTLNAAIGDNNDWYGLGIYSRTKADIIEVAAWVQGQGSLNPKLFVAQSSDADLITSATTDLASTLQASASFRTSVWYHSLDAEYLDMGLMGGQLPTDPGSITWAFKTLSSVTVDSLTSGEKSNLHAKAGNTYTTVASVNITEQGKVSDSPFEWIDVIRGVDWLQVNITADLYTLLVNLPKLPYDSKGIGTVQTTILNRLQIAQGQGILSRDTAPVVSVPDLADVPAADKGTRTLNNVTFTGVLAGAIQKINVVGTVTL